MKKSLLFVLCCLLIVIYSCQKDSISNDALMLKKGSIKNSAPILDTSSIIAFADTWATIQGNITSNGGTAVTERGICWGTTKNPTIKKNKVVEGNVETGTYLTRISDLQPGTRYYVRAFASNAVGTGYGEEIILTTQSITQSNVTDIDGNVYNSVPIGSQVWMVENLKTTKYNDRTSISLVTDNAAWGGLTTGAYSWYDNDNNNKEPYGALYNWYAVNSAILCPSGWHVPTSSEWSTLTTFLGGESIAGSKLKEPGRTHWIYNNSEATNESGFTALPGGQRNLNDENGIFTSITLSGLFWATDNSDERSAAMRYINGDNVVGNTYSTKTSGLSVRCIKN